VKNKIEMRIATSSIYWTMTSIVQGGIVIPAFQRDYVWTRKNVEELVDSLVKQYPIGAITTIGAAGLPRLPIKDVWLTQQGVDACHQHVVDRGIKPDYLYVLDGAQRLQTMYKLLVNGDYRLLYNPIFDHWKVRTPEEQQREGDIFPYISITEMFAYHFSRDGEKLGDDWYDAEKVEKMLASPGLAPCKDPHLNAVAAKAGCLTLWQYRMKEELLRYRQREKSGNVFAQCEDEDALLDQYIESGKRERALPKSPEPLHGSEYTAKEKAARRREIDKVEKKRAEERHKIYLEFKEAIDAAREPNSEAANERLSKMVDEFESNLISRSNIVLNRFSVGEDGDLKEAVKVFKRINMAGVPVDMSFLDKLSEEQK
jgi:hypothetical protein